MAGNYRATGECQQRFFQALQGFNVQIVGGLVQKQQVATLLQSERQVQAIALAAGKHASGLLLVRALEAEVCNVGAAGNFLLAHADVIQPVGNHFPKRLLRVKAFAVLVYVGNLHGFAQGKGAAGYRLLANDHLEQGRFAYAVGADYAHNAVARQAERKVVNEHAVAELLVQMFHFQNLCAQAGANRNGNCGEVNVFGAAGFRFHLLVALQARLVLGLARLGAGANPLQLVLHALYQLGLLLALGLQAGSLGFQVGGVVALVRVQVATVNFADPLGNVVQEVAVVRYGQHGTGVTMQELLQPQHRFSIQVVSRLVQKQQVGSFKQQLAQRHAPALAARKHLYRSIRVGALQGIHGLRKLAVQIPAVGGVDFVLQGAHFFHKGIEIGIGVGHLQADSVEALNLGKHIGKRHANVLDYRCLFVQRGLLLQNAHGVARRKTCIACRNLLQASHYLEQGRFAHAVGTHHADFGARVERKRNVVQDDLVTMGLARLIHLIDEFSHRYSFR